MQEPRPHKRFKPLDFPCQEYSTHDGDDTDGSKLSGRGVELIFGQEDVYAQDGDEDEIGQEGKCIAKGIDCLLSLLACQPYNVWRHRISKRMQHACEVV